MWWKNNTCSTNEVDVIEEINRVIWVNYVITRFVAANLRGMNHLPDVQSS